MKPKRTHGIAVKALCALMALLICVTAAPFAYAAEADAAESGAETDTAAQGANNGPAGTGAYIALMLNEGDTSYQYLYTSKRGELPAAADGAASYSLETNTLTLTDLRAYSFEINKMGEDFKIVLNGENTVEATFDLWGDAWSASARFTGEGSLSIGNCLTACAENSPTVITVDENVALTIEGGIQVYDSTAEIPLVIRGRERSGGKVGNAKMTVVPAYWHYDLENTTYGQMYYNPTRPYKQYSQFADIEYFQVMTTTTTTTRRTDMLEHKAVQFSIRSVTIDEEGRYIVQTTITNIYVWDDSPLYKIFEDNPREMKLSDYDPTYQYIEPEGLNEGEVTVIDADGDALDTVEIVPLSSSVPDRPVITAKTLPNGFEHKAYTAQVTAAAGNQGGRIVGYKLTGTSSKWLSIDENGNLSGIPSSVGGYKATVTAIEEVNGEEVESLPRTFTLRVGAPDRYLTFGTSVSDGFAHTVTVTNLDSGEKKIINLASGNIGPFTTVDLSDLADGSYNASFTAEATGALVTYPNSSIDFDIDTNSKNIVTLTPGEPEVAYYESSVFLTVKNFAAISKLSTIKATLTLSNGKVVNKYPTASIFVFANVLEEGVTVTSAALTAKDEIGQDVEVQSGSPVIDGGSVTLTATANNFSTYFIYDVPSDLNSAGITITVNGHVLRYTAGKQYALKRLTSDDVLKWEKAEYATEYQKQTYDFDHAAPSFSSGMLHISINAFKRTASLTGTVTDEDGAPLQGVAITYCQNYNGLYDTASTVTDADGCYKLTRLINGKEVALTASLSGYDQTEVKLTASSSGTQNVTLKKQSAITVFCDTEVYKASFSWSGDDVGRKNFTASSSVFTLPLTKPGIDGTVTVVMTSSSTVGKTTGKVQLKNGSGVLNLSPTLKGVIDWSGYDAEGNETENYSAYLISINNRHYYSIYGTSASLDPGAYTVRVYGYGDINHVLASQELTVKSGETSYLTVKIPDSAKANLRCSGTAHAPASAATDEIYKVEGVISAIDNDRINAITFYNMTDNFFRGGAEYAVINGTRVALDFGVAGYSSHPDVDWSLPLSYTAYFRQGATAYQPVQTVSITVQTCDRNGKGITQSTLGTVSTAYSPGITFNTVSAVNGTKVSNDDGSYYYLPKPVAFSGTAVENSEVRIYDNDVLTAVVTADSVGKYSGKLSLLSSENYHILKAECTVAGATAEATSMCTYNPTGAMLTSLRLINNESVYYEVPRDGGRLAYGTSEKGNLSFDAIFENADQLEDITCAIDGKDVTGKVFFLFNTVGGPKILKSTTKDNVTWTSAKYYHGLYFPRGVQVLYKSKVKDYSTTVTYTDVDGSTQELNVDYAMKRTGVDTTDGEYTSTADYKAYARGLIELAASLSSDSDLAGTGANIGSASAAKDDKEEEDEKPFTSKEVYSAVTAIYNAGDAPGRYSVLSAQQAAEKCPEGRAEIRTYTDSPQYTFTDQNLKLTFDLLEAYKYRSFSYLDDASGHQMYMFSGTFYYSAQALPVPSVQIQKNYSGILHTEDDPRLFYNGKLVGSKLEVTYICDVTAKKWYRTQEAYIPSGAKSPIHTNAWQIPSVYNPPYEYKDTTVFPVSAAPDTGIAMTGANIGGASTGANDPAGFKFDIDFTKVSGKTYTSAVMSLGGYGTSKVMSSTMIGDKAKLLKVDKRTCKLMNQVDECIDFANHEGANIYYVTTTKESLVSAGVMYGLGKANDKVNAGSGVTTTSDALGVLSKELRDNMRYWGGVKTAANSCNAENNYGVMGDFSGDLNTANRMIKRTREMADALTELETAIEAAQTQNEFTAGVTEKTGYVSLFASIVPGPGSEVSLALDACCFLLNAANDTNNAKVMEAYDNFMQKYKAYVAEDQEYKDYIKKDEDFIKSQQKMGSKIKSRSDACGRDLNDDPVDDSVLESGQQSSMEPVHDPSGVVYEAVLSNPVEGATVTLYRYDGESDPLSVWDDSAYLGQSNPVTSDEGGFYRWDVPEGEWYVTAEKAGYVAGSSQNDVEATVTHGDVNYLPVLPPQLEVNIPLVSYAAPEVETVVAKTDGVYVTFTKYMNESDLKEENFILTDSGGTPVAYKLEKLDSEQAPANIRYDGEAPYYTKTVRLSAVLAENAELSLRVAGEVRSYADVNMTAPYDTAVTVEKKKTLAAPVFSVPSGEIEKGTVITITAEEGADLIYTTDGSEPSAENGTIAREKAEISLIIDTTVKAIAVRSDAVSSEAASAAYAIRRITVEPVREFSLGDVDGDGTVMIVDATYIQRHIAGMPIPFVFDRSIADTDEDGDVTIMDATYIQRWLAGSPSNDNIGKTV